MVQVLRASWALMLGMFMLQIGNGLQGTLLGIRGEMEDFSTFDLSVVMSAYFAGFLFGSRMAPRLIRSVGHVRVFAALASLISAVFILYPALTEPWAWTLGRIIIGFCFSAVYVTAESWLNNSADNANRGKALSVYMVVQTAGIIVGQYLLLAADPSGYLLFIFMSVLVSLSFAPILLTATPVPAFEATRPMSLRQLYEASPLASVGMLILGGVFAAQFGMAAVFATQAGFDLGQTSLFISAIFGAALLAQYPIGWLSDRIDRRVLVVALAAMGGAGALLGVFSTGSFPAMLVAASMVGAASNPLYSLLLAYANDYLEHEDMAAASAGFVFVNGIGAVVGPLMIGWLMGWIGPAGFWLFVTALLFAMTGYGIYRVRVRPRPSPTSGEATPYAPLSQSASPVAVELAQEVYIEAELGEEPEAN